MIMKMILWIIMKEMKMAIKNDINDENDNNDNDNDEWMKWKCIINMKWY